MINQVLEGEEVVIAKRGVPLVKLTLYEKKSTQRKGGQLKGIEEESLITNSFNHNDTYIKIVYKFIICLLS